MVYIQWINGLNALTYFFVEKHSTIENYSQIFFISTYLYYGREQGLNHDFNISGGSF